MFGLIDFEVEDVDFAPEDFVGDPVSLVAAPPPAKPAPTSAVKVKAVAGKSKLFVDVNPNKKGNGYWKFQVQYKKKNGKWGTYKTVYKTQGKNETRTLNFKKGTYRVILKTSDVAAQSISKSVTLKK